MLQLRVVGRTQLWRVIAVTEGTDRCGNCDIVAIIASERNSDSLRSRRSLSVRARVTRPTRARRFRSAGIASSK
jgi:hypothetical protein